MCVRVRVRLLCVHASERVGVGVHVYVYVCVDVSVRVYAIRLLSALSIFVRVDRNSRHGPVSGRGVDLPIKQH